VERKSEAIEDDLGATGFTTGTGIACTRETAGVARAISMRESAGAGAGDCASAAASPASHFAASSTP